MNIAELARLAERNQVQHEHAVVETFGALRIIDPEVVEQMDHVFGDRIKAARWFAGPVRSLCGARPMQMLAEGNRADVLCVLYQIGHGVYG